ncbi:unnamed protein product [Oikopleura dioica]|uniref:Uncharacterized protein n=1 Tax=Oikopleura dioica TaxID=34765 RepID=E4Y036_OIKDI|nr:unnamed protein product [Oikopleura dioica]
MRFTLLLFFIAVIYGDESSEVAVEGEVADVVTESPPTTKASTTASTVSTEEQQETDEAITKEAAISNTTDPTQEATSNATQSTATTAQTPQATQKAQTTQSTQATQATQSTQAPQTTTQESAVIRQGVQNDDDADGSSSSLIFASFLFAIFATKYFSIIVLPSLNQCEILLTLLLTMSIKARKL